MKEKDNRSLVMKRTSNMYHNITDGKLKICLYQRVRTPSKAQRNVLNKQVLNSFIEQYQRRDIVEGYRD